jgi:hypothetical protein
MNKRIKKLWIKALRSGKYRQGYRQLKRGRGNDAAFCCLGVLCEVAKQEGVIKAYRPTDGFPSNKVLAWANLKDMNPKLGRKSATVLNDALQ